MAKRMSLIDIAKSAKRNNETWISKLDPQDRKEIIEIAKMLISGELTGVRLIASQIASARGIPITRHKLMGLVDKVRSGAPIQ